MKLTIGSKSIALPEKAKISIERSSPLLNDDTGSFSFPFPIPTIPNQQALGWPGKLQRSGDIADQSFVLEDGGIQVFRGEIDFDDITAKEIGLILKSGYSEFTQKMEGKKLGDIDYGGTPWPVIEIKENQLDTLLYPIFNSWDAANTTDNGKFVLTPFLATDKYGSTIIVNSQRAINKTVTYLEIPLPHTYQYDVDTTRTPICFQFRVHFLLNKIFESAGYTVVENSLASSEFKDLILFSQILSLAIYQSKLTAGGVTDYGPFNVVPPYFPFVGDNLQYSAVMPDFTVLDFMAAINKMFCIMYEIDELKKEVRIKFKKDVFLPENLDGMKIPELAGWTHREEKALKGFALAYTSQDNSQDTEYDYSITKTVSNTLPATTKEGEVYHVSDYNRDYIVVTNSADALEWQEIGRLKERREGDGENSVEINVKVPAQTKFSYMDNTNGYKLNLSGTDFEAPSLLGFTVLSTVSFLAMTLYHGRKTFAGKSFPYASFDRFSIDGTKDVGISLKPSYLYLKVYSDFLNWQTYRAREFTKYIELSLPQLVSLQWGKRYVIDGVIVVLNTINYDLPYDGKVKIEGFTG